MKSFSQSVSVILKGAIAAAGVVGVCTLTAGTAAAENASVSGAVTYTRPAGFSISFSAEKVAPAGFMFNDAVTVTAVTNAEGVPTSMTVDAGAATAIGTAPTGPAAIKDAVIAELNALDPTASTAQLDVYAAILKAAAGTDGLE
jgi:hypothetical protein